jgi:hypothetical protein
MNPYILSLHALENKLASRSLREKVVEEHTASGVLAEYEFEVYLHSRLSQNIEDEKFTNIVQNIYVYGDLRRLLGEKLADFMSSEYLKGNFVHYFQKMAFAFPNDFGLLLAHRTVYHISHNYNQSDMVAKTRVLAQHTDYTLSWLMTILGTHCIERGDKFKFLLLLDHLELSERYDLLVESSRTHNMVFSEMEDALGDGRFFDYVNEQMTDESSLCKAIRSIYTMHNSSLSKLEQSINLRRLLFNNPEKIPQTLEHVLQLATTSERYDIVIQLCSCFPKKRILGILTAHGDPNLVDKFFFLYKNYPEIKRLAPFI